MPRDWPDPRDDQPPVPRWEIWLVGALGAIGLWSLLARWVG